MHKTSYMERGVATKGTTLPTLHPTLHPDAWAPSGRRTSSSWRMMALVFELLTVGTMRVGMSYQTLAPILGRFTQGRFGANISPMHSLSLSLCPLQTSAPGNSRKKLKTSSYGTNSHSCINFASSKSQRQRPEISSARNPDSLDSPKP